MLGMTHSMRSFPSLSECVVIASFMSKFIAGDGKSFSKIDDWLDLFYVTIINCWFQILGSDISSLHPHQELHLHLDVDLVCLVHVHHRVPRSSLRLEGRKLGRQSQRGSLHGESQYWMQRVRIFWDSINTGADYLGAILERIFCKQ